MHLIGFNINVHIYNVILTIQLHVYCEYVDVLCVRYICMCVLRADVHASIHTCYNIATIINQHKYIYKYLTIVAITCVFW